MKKRIIIILLMALLLTGCGGPKVIKENQRSEKEVKQYVIDKITTSYPGVEVEFQTKNQEKVYATLCLDGCESSPPSETVKGGYEYIFSIKDSQNNIAIAKYRDAVKYDGNISDNILIETYSIIVSEKEKLNELNSIINKYINPYITDSYYRAIENDGMHYYIDIITKVNINYNSLTPEQKEKFVLIAKYYKSHRTSTRLDSAMGNHKFFKDGLLHVDQRLFFVFNDKDELVEVTTIK